MEISFIFQQPMLNALTQRIRVLCVKHFWSEENNFTNNEDKCKTIYDIREISLGWIIKEPR